MSNLFQKHFIYMYISTLYSVYCNSVKLPYYECTSLSPELFRLLRLGVFDEQFPTEISVNFLSLFSIYACMCVRVPVSI
jgi:hypothetical protein